MLFELLILISGLLLLILGSRWLVQGASALAASLGVSAFIIGVTIVAMGTSAPETTLALMSSIDGDPSLSFGNVIGANMSNIGLVIGMACLLYPVATRFTLLRREIAFLVISVLAVAIMGLDGSIGPMNSIVLITGAVVFNSFVFRSAKSEMTLKRDIIVKERPEMKRWKMAALIIIGLVLLICGSNLVLEGGVALAAELGVDQFTIGLTIVALGTTMPELAVSVTSARRKETDLLLGNAIGSIIFNTLLIIGLAGTFTPLSIPDNYYSMALPFTLVMYSVLILFMFAKRKMNRISGIALLSIYVAYLAIMIV